MWNWVDLFNCKYPGKLSVSFSILDVRTILASAFLLHWIVCAVWKKKRNMWLVFQTCVYVCWDIPYSHVVPTLIVTKNPSYPTDSYLLKWLLKLGAPQKPLWLHSQALPELILTIPGKCQHSESNFFTLTLSLKLLSHFLFSASLKESTEMSFAASSVMDGFPLSGR